MMFVFVLLCTSALAAAIERPYFDPKRAEKHFKEYIVNFNKQYANEEETRTRFEIFKNNLAIINARNLNSSAVHGLTPFTDWTFEEFDRLNGFRIPLGDDNLCKVQTDADFPDKKAPDSYDWRKQKAVSPVKDQVRCGSCWAFSAIGNVEGQIAIKTGQLKSFSEQQLVDCVKGTDCLHGGEMKMAMRTIINEGGLEPEEAYPYTASQHKCAFDKSKVEVKLSDCTHYKFQSEEVLKEALYKIGPLSIAIDASRLASYHSHLLDRDLCPEGGSVTHAVLLVGYGTENGIPVWYIKNSWGEKWGDQGFFTMRRNANMCSIMHYGATTGIIA